MGIEAAIAMAVATSTYSAQQQSRAMQQDSGGHYQDPILAKRRTGEQASGKCQSCGSRQFVTHNAARKCSYCRSEQ